MPTNSAMISALVSCVLSERKKKRVSTIDLSHVVLFSFAVITAHWKASRILRVVFFSFSRLISSFFLSFLYIYIYIYMFPVSPTLAEKKKTAHILTRWTVSLSVVWVGASTSAERARAGEYAKKKNTHKASNTYIRTTTTCVEHTVVDSQACLFTYLLCFLHLHVLSFL